MGPYVVGKMEHAVKGGVTCWQSFIFVLVVVTRFMKFSDDIWDHFTNTHS
jgi:hypothetical protein